MRIVNKISPGPSFSKRGAILQNNRGFSLLEVIVAFVVLSLAITAMLNLSGASLRSFGRADNHTMAVAYAKALMEEAYAMAEVKEGTEEFEYPKGFKAVRTIRIVSPEEERRESKAGPALQDDSIMQAERNAQKFEIKVGVTWPPSGGYEIVGMRAVRIEEE